MISVSDTYDGITKRAAQSTGAENRKGQKCRSCTSPDDLRCEGDVSVYVALQDQSS